MSGHPKDYYTSMVMNASGFAGVNSYSADAPLQKPSGSTLRGGSSGAQSVSTRVSLNGPPRPRRVPKMMTLPQHQPQHHHHHHHHHPQQQQHYRQLNCQAPSLPSQSSPSLISAPPVVESPRPEPKVYTHNPYAPSCCLVSSSYPTTTNAIREAPMQQFGPAPIGKLSSGRQSLSASAFLSTSISDSWGMEDHNISGVSHDQFCNMIGNIPANAITPHGRHFLVSVLRQQQLDKTQVIYDELAMHFNTVALDLHGCHVIRTLIEFISTKQLEQLIPRVHPSVVLQLACLSQNTRRVLHAMFEHHCTEALTTIVEVVASDCQRLAVTQQGCIAINHMMEKTLPQQKSLLLSRLLPILPSLAMNAFGNYVVQCIINNVDPYTTFKDVVDAFQGHWVKLSCDKFSSNVMEKIVSMLEGNARQAFINELVYDVNNLKCLMHDSFGNYVLQAVIGSAVNQCEYRQIYDAVAPHLQISPYGHRIEAKLKSRYNVLYGVSSVDISYPESRMF